MRIRDTDSWVGVQSNSGQSIGKAVLISPDEEFAESIRNLPLNIYYRNFSGMEDNLVESILKVNPDVIVVCSGELSNSRAICSRIQMQCNAPILFINRGEYPASLDFEGFADVDVNEPRSLREMQNLGIEIWRLAYDVPVPAVRIGLASATSKGRFKWILTIGLSIAFLSGAISVALGETLQQGIQTMLTTFSAITSVEVGTLVQHYLRNRKRSGT